MDHDLTLMIYGALMGVVGSIVSSLVSTLFQFWLARREYERKQYEEQHKQLNQIYLPTEEEVIAILQSQSDHEETSISHPAARAGSLVLSVVVSSFLIYQTKNLWLGFAFSAVLGFVVTKRVMRLFRGR